MASGGRRPGAGRPKGSHTSRTRARLEIATSKGITPLEYLLTVLRDDKQDQAVRIDAAKSAAPYVHPRLANVELGEDPNKPFNGKFPILANA